MELLIVFFIFLGAMGLCLGLGVTMLLPLVLGFGLFFLLAVRRGYAPKEVITLLNGYKDKILAVRGNCEAEVDQMVLSFPVLAEYALLSFDGITVFATHGHIHNTEKCPPLMKGDILLHGHTHVQTCTPFGNENFYINPGSISLPKEGNPRTYMLYENRTFTLKDFEGKTLWEKKL